MPDGRFATCTENSTLVEDLNGRSTSISSGDLFWALRGGGGGTFGVVVEYLFKLHPEPGQMVVMSTFIPFVMPQLSADLTISSLNMLIAVIKSLPNEWGGYWIVDNSPGVLSNNDTGLGFDLHYRGQMTLFMNKFAPWDGTEYTVFKDLLDYATENTITVNFENKTSFWDYEKDVYDQPITRGYLYNSLLQKEKLNETFSSFVNKSFFDDTGKDILQGCTGALLGG